MGVGYQRRNPHERKPPGPIGLEPPGVKETEPDAASTQYEDVVTVFDPVAGFVTGGGTFRIDGDLVRFGINLKYKTKARPSRRRREASSPLGITRTVTSRSSRATPSTARWRSVRIRWGHGLGGGVGEGQL